MDEDKEMIGIKKFNEAFNSLTKTIGILHDYSEVMVKENVKILKSVTESLLQDIDHVLKEEET